MIIPDKARRINYKSDFEFSLKLVQQGEQVAWPAVPFTIKIEGSLGDYFAYYDGEKFENCSMTTDGCVVYVNNHKLGAGQLRVQLQFIFTDEKYPDGKQKVTITDSSIYLVKEGGSLLGEEKIGIEAALDYAVIDAYMMAKANGYEGTAEDYIKALSDLVKNTEDCLSATEKALAMSAKIEALMSILGDGTGLKLNIVNGGQYWLDWGDDIEVKCILEVLGTYIGDLEHYKGKTWNWTVTRDSGDEINDNIWNAGVKATAFNSAHSDINTITISYKEGDNDLGNSREDCKTTFTFKAVEQSGESVVTASVII